MRPKRLNASIATLFMIGSSCFALGTVPAYAHAVGSVADASTFFVGSIFFTCASFLQLIQAQTPSMVTDASGSEGPQSLKLWGPRWRDRNWLAAATQFPGTLAFNVSTVFAIVQSLTIQQTDRLVWRPDFVGSILFLVSSALAVIAVDGHFMSWSPRDTGWRIAWLNMAGSVFFMISAIGALLLPATGTYFNAQWANLGTFLGAACFFWGAALMLPWREQPTGRTTSARA